MLHHFARICLLTACLLGLGCGRTGSPSSTELATSSGDSTSNGSNASALVLPLLEVTESSPDLGDADIGDKKVAPFSVLNRSGKPLTVSVVNKTCGCSRLEPNVATIPAGKSQAFNVVWEPGIDQPLKEKVELEFDLQALGNRNAAVKLVATGRFRPSLIVGLPNGELDFGRLDVGDLKTGKKELPIEVYTQDPRHKDFTLQVTSTSPGLKLVPSTPQRLPADRLSFLNAVSGYRLNIQCGEGLPIGSFRERLTLKSSVYPMIDLEVDVFGTVESGAVSISPEGVKLAEKTSVTRGYRAPPVEITLRGADPGRTMTIEHVDPPFLLVGLERVAGKENTWRLTATIPAGEQELLKKVTPQDLEDYLSFGFDPGVIVLHTDHKLVPVLRIPVDRSQLER
jgi:hypothetical protein